MALTLIATAGDASANTYATLEEAEAYFEGVLECNLVDGVLAMVDELEPK